MASDDDIVRDLEATRARLAACQAELERSKRELEELSRVMAHDLRSPLRGITTFGELLAEEYGEHLEGDGAAYLGFITDGAERMRTMVDALVRFARLEGRKDAPEVVQLSEVLDEVTMKARPALDARGGTLIREGDPGTVSAIRLQMVQLFQNLVDNAIKFSPHAPRITVRGRVENDRVVVEVIDEGIGLSAHPTDRIFNIFERAVDRDAFPGIGVGLAICRKVVERHGGRIEAHDGEGKGARFVVRLPR